MLLHFQVNNNWQVALCLWYDTGHQETDKGKLIIFISFKFGFFKKNSRTTFVTQFISLLKNTRENTLWFGFFV